MFKNLWFLSSPREINPRCPVIFDANKKYIVVLHLVIHWVISRPIIRCKNTTGLFSPLASNYYLLVKGKQCLMTKSVAGNLILISVIIFSLKWLIEKKVNNVFLNQNRLWIQKKIFKNIQHISSTLYFDLVISEDWG